MPRMITHHIHSFAEFKPTRLAAAGFISTRSSRK